MTIGFIAIEEKIVLPEHARSPLLLLRLVLL